MHDYGNEAAEKAIKKLDKKIQDVYREAEKDLQKKMDEFIRKYKIKEQKYLEQVAEGKISQADFDAWKRGQVFQGRQWRTKQRSIADVLYRSGEVSTKMINDMALGVCAENVNWAAYTIEHGFGVNFGFNLYDESTVANLIKKEPDILPKWKIEKEKNYIWNKKKLNNAVTQGIIQGEKLDEIAKRVAVGLSGSDQNLMKTFAKTAMTGAQNAGREVSYKNAQKLGINLKKEWVATLDKRTRDSHARLDGQKADIGKPYKVDGEEIRYPGDPTAKPYLVYNCRCTEIADLIDYPAEEYERYDNIEGKPVKGMTYKEWEQAKKNGEDITATIVKQAVKKEKRVVQFVPAKTIEEAEQYARERFVVEKTWRGDGNVSYHGMSLDIANAINEELTALFEETNLPKLDNIEMMNFRKDFWKPHKKAPMAYSSVQRNGEIFLNPHILKSQKTVDEYYKEARKAWTRCMENADKFTGRDLETIKTYMQAGVSNVDELSNSHVKALLDHEFGHHIDHQILMKNDDLFDVTKDGMEEWGIKISGYATTRRGEYVAESFAAYWGNLKPIDPKLKKIFEEVVRK